MSPKVYDNGGYKYFFYSNEEERMHIHVTDKKCSAKFWIEPRIELAENKGVPHKSLKKMQRSIEENESQIRAKWQKHFG